MEIGVLIAPFARYPKGDVRESVSIGHKESDQSLPVCPFWG
jgi:hypothetical protein